MANNLVSNTTDKVMREFLKEFESDRVVTKTVNTSVFRGEFEPAFGETIKVKRPHQYNSVETAGGDISALDKNNITSGSAFATVQSYITVALEWTNREETLELDQLMEIIRPAAAELVTKLETNLSRYMIANLGLSRGTMGAAINAWGDVAGNYSLLSSIGVPMAQDCYAVMSPFAVQNLADTQSGLASGSNNLVDMAWNKAQISKDFGGMKGLTSNALVSTTLGALAGESGTVKTTPVGTYVAAKDSMTQSITLTGLTVSTVDAVRAGDTITITQADRSRLNVMTREVAFDQAGQIAWTYKVVTGGDTDGSGDVTVVVTTAAINETDGQYNNISNAIVATDTFKLEGTPNLVVQPSLFYSKDAIALTSVKLPKLHTWENTVVTTDSFSIRCTKYSDADTNKQMMRFDLLPAFGVLNPQFGGTFFGA